MSLSSLVTAALVLATSVTASADESLRYKRFRFENRNGRLEMTGGFREVFDRDLRRRLHSGFTMTVLMRTHLYPVGQQARPIAVSARRLDVAYDLWEHVFVLETEDSRRRRQERMAKAAAVVDRLTSFWRFPLLATDKLRPQKRYFVAVLVEVNPLQAGVADEVKRWLRNPRSGRPRSLGGQSLFGSFVSIFVKHRVSRAERVFSLRSQPFFRER